MTLPAVAFVYPGKARRDRLDGIETGENPLDFFHGYPHLKGLGYPVSILDSRTDPKGPIGRAALKAEYFRGRLFKFATNLQRVRAIAADLDRVDIALSFTDSFSLSMGLYRSHLNPRSAYVGGFHGLADIVEFANPLVRNHVHARIRRALHNLDHTYFFGDADRWKCIELYDLPEDKTSLFLTGADLEFWRPGDVDGVTEADYVLSVGSDPKRDYATLLNAPFDGKLRIISRLKFDVPENRPDVEILRGSLYGSDITDKVLRSIYQESQLVAVSLLDVWQPTGYSVTVQAMACGKPVVLTGFRGLWDADVFESGVNCILVPPGNPQAMGEAIRSLQEDPDLRVRIGAEARESAEKYFALSRMETSLEQLIGMVSKRL